MTIIVYLFFSMIMVPRKYIVLVGGAPPPRKFSDIWRDIK
jgi:hypothetical protein